MTQPSLFPTDKEQESTLIPWNKSVLKSAVQKCVRRGEPERAVIIAKAAMQKDLLDFVRRLMVIVPEDCVLHPEYDKLADLVKVVSSGNPILDTDRDFILQVVYDIAASEWRDTEFHNPDEVVVNGEYEYLNQKQKDLVDALKYRASIGGMKWDIIFLNQYVKIWTHRFANGFTPSKLEAFFKEGQKQKIMYDRVRPMEPKDIPLVAIDIHALPPIKRMLLNKQLVQNQLVLLKDIREKYYPKDSDEWFLAGLMWQGYISTNYKKVFWYDPPAELNRMHESLGTTPEEEKRIYEFADIIMPEVEAIAKWFIRKQQHPYDHGSDSPPTPTVKGILDIVNDTTITTIEALREQVTNYMKEGEAK